MNKNEFEYSWLAATSAGDCHDLVSAVNSAFIYLQVMSKLIDPFPQRLKVKTQIKDSKITPEQTSKLVICFLKSGKRLSYELDKVLETPFVIEG